MLPIARRRYTGSRGTVFATAAAMSAMMVKLSNWPWDVVAAVLSAAVLISYFMVEFMHPWARRRKLKHPCDVSFVIPPQRDSQHCEYAILDDEWHVAKEITVPPHAEIHLELRLVPRLNFTESEFAFGCDSDGNLDKKPFAFEFFSSFVDRGKKVANPDNDEDHYTDRHQYYQIGKDQWASIILWDWL